MITDTLILVAAALALELIVTGIGKLINMWGQRTLPQTAQAELSETDKQKVEETKKLIRQCFGENVTEWIRRASNRERIELMAEFAERLAREYGLDIDVDVTVNNINNYGSYDWKEKRAEFNIALLMVDGSNEHFDYCVRATLDTIIHELRHAVQHKAIENSGFWNVDEERRTQWATNMAPENYIRAEVDLRGYASQPIEKDATTFAALAMEGVK